MSDQRDTTRKIRGIRFTDECYAQCQSIENQKLANVSSNTEYVEKAVLHYTAFLHSESDQEYLCSVFGSQIDSRLNHTDRALSRSLCKLAVNINVMNHLLSSARRMTVDEYKKLYKISEKEVIQTSGVIDLQEMLTRHLENDRNFEAQKDTL